MVLIAVAALDHQNFESKALLTCNQHHAEPCFAFDHASVSITSLFERKCLDHRTDILQDAEGQSVFVIDRRAGQRSVNRAPSKNKRHRTQLDRVLGYTHHDELAAW